MPTTGQESASKYLYSEVERDFDALVRLIDRAIEHMATDGRSISVIESLNSAKKAAERGAALARKH